jgi:hypothetical protein
MCLKRGKKGCGSVAVSHVINKPLPLPPPDALMLSAQRTPKRTPERGIEEEVLHMNGVEGMPSEDTSP